MSFLQYTSLLNSKYVKNNEITKTKNKFCTGGGFNVFGEWGLSVGVGLMYEKSHPCKNVSRKGTMVFIGFVLFLCYLKVIYVYTISYCFIMGCK